MSEISREALEYLVSLGENAPPTYEINGEIFVCDSNGRAIKRLSDEIEELERNKEVEQLQHKYRLENEELKLKYAQYNIPHYIETHTLESIITYVKANPENVFGEIFKPLIHIEANNKITLTTKMDIAGNRRNLITANAILPKLTFGQHMSTEMFIIMLQTQFADTEDKQTILKLVSNLTDEETFNVKDDGIRQTVTVRKGAVDLGEERIPNPLVLAPFRTFVEAEQPRSHYLIRINDKGQPALFEVGGNEWQLTAMSNIKKYLSENLEDIEVDIWM